MTLKQLIFTAAAICSLPPAGLWAAISFTVDANGWPNPAHRDAAVSSMQGVIDRYNAHGDFGNYNVWVYYNAGIPTAQANYLGSIGFGGTYPNQRVSQHELNHYLGTGTMYPAWGNLMVNGAWRGSRANAIIAQFEGVGAVMNGDGSHHWPYGLNYDNEGGDLNMRRSAALTYALRQDLGVGSQAPASAASDASLTASDTAGSSSFNHPYGWSDNHFAQPATNYSTGDFALRTPNGYPSWTFGGASLRVNNKTNPNGGLLYNGWGTTGVVSFKNLIVDGGTVKHDQFSQDLFQLAGKVTLASGGTFNAAQGNIKVLASIGGPGSLTKTGANTLTLTGSGTYGGDTIINAGTLQLASIVPIANYSFDSVSGATVINRGNGGTGMNGTLAGGAAIVGGGKSGNAVSLAGGASVNINNPVANLDGNANWTISAWVKTATPGGSLLTKGDGSSWSDGNTIFYLGDGTAGGSGGIPSSVRYGGGFFQGSTGATSVTDNTWHQVTYVNAGGNYAIYVDGVAQPLAAGNAGFGNGDVGAMVRLGASTNTFAGDGTLNFNGLMDNVQFYTQALSPIQVAALHDGTRVAGSLPSTTNVTIASGATLDLAGGVQQIGSLTGAAGSAIALGSGRLVVNSPASTQFGGAVSGFGGALVKQGAGTLALNGANTYSGKTTIEAGMLSIANPFLSDQSDVDLLTGATLDLNFSATDVIDSLFFNGFSEPVGVYGAIGSGAAFERSYLLGTGFLQVVTQEGAAIAGDFDHNGVVNAADLAKWTGDFGGAGSDADGDGDSDGQDFLVWQQTLGASGPAAVATPEPQALVMAALACAALVPCKRRRMAAR